MAIYLYNEGGNIIINSNQIESTTRVYYGGAGTSGNFKPADVSRSGTLNGFLINLGEDSYSVKFEDLVINGYSPTTLLIAAEALQGLFSNTPYTPPPLMLKYNKDTNIPNYTLADWNEFFHLGGDDYYGIPFTSVVIEGANVLLRGGKDITLRENLYQDSGLIVDVTDDAYCITSAESYAFVGCSNLITVSMPSLQTAGYQCFGDCTSATTFNLPSLQIAEARCFGGCTSATSFNFPLLQNAGDTCFQSCTSATSFNLPLAQQIGNQCFKSCTSATLFNLPVVTNLGDTVEDDSVFATITGNTISLTIPSVLMTCNAGEPDGDIIYLQDNNDVTITLV